MMLGTTNIKLYSCFS